MYNLRPYQQDTAVAIKEDFFGGTNNLLVQLPTGTGKTILFGSLPDFMEIGERRAMFIAHTDELCQQAADKLSKLNPTRTIGIEKASSYAGNAQLVVASVQTLSRSPDRLASFNPEDFAILLTDEAHHATGDSYGKIFEHMGVKYRKDILNLGVTATTNRSDGQGLNKVYDKISKQYKIFDAMKDGWLSDLRCRKVCTTTNLDTVPRKGQDFDLIQLSKELDTPYRNDLVVRAYEEYGENRKFLGFAVDIKHAQHLAKRFQEAGHNVEAVWGDDPLRADKLRRHRAGDIHGLFNCAFLTEGYDDWTIQCIILARSTQSTPLLTQIIGRGLRIPDGCDNLKEAIRRGDTLAKTDCLILDIADVSTKHTLATVPNLFGLGDKVDMEGRSMLAVVPEVELIQAQKPYLDITNLDKIGDLYTYAEQVDMFRVEAPPEIIQLSEFRWMKHGNDSYYLSLKDGEYLFVLSDMLGKWTLSGKCNGNTVVRQRETLEDAIKEGDYVVRMLGGRVFENMARRVTKTGMRPPSKAQLDLLRKLGLRPPPGMKSDEIRNMISKRLLELNYRKKNNR